MILRGFTALVNANYKRTLFFADSFQIELLVIQAGFNCILPSEKQTNGIKDVYIRL